MAALAQKNYGTETATIMVLGMLINIALARLTPLKYIFLTGHHTLYMAAMLAVILSVGGLSGVGGGHRGGDSRRDDGDLSGDLAAVYP
jgi:PTS system ascorbate-specific IIC component